MAKTAEPNHTVTMRAFVQRLRLRLARDGKQLKGKRGRGMSGYFVVDTAKGCVLEDDVDLERLGKRLKVLDDWEVLEKA